jgi:hypothetical protein
MWRELGWKWRISPNLKKKLRFLFDRIIFLHCDIGKRWVVEPLFFISYHSSVSFIRAFSNESSWFYSETAHYRFEYEKTREWLSIWIEENAAFWMSDGWTRWNYLSSLFQANITKKVKLMEKNLTDGWMNIDNENAEKTKTIPLISASSSCSIELFSFVDITL